MSEVKKYNAYAEGLTVHFELDSEGAWVAASDFDAERLRADTAEAERESMRAERNDAELRAGRLKVDNENYDRLLTRKSNQCHAAEQRIAELEKDAARYQWLRDKSESVHQFYLSTPIWFTGVKFKKENVDSTIDAALNPNPEAESHE
jgi:hypothetical protein